MISSCAQRKYELPKLTSTQNRQSKAHAVILVGSQEKHAINQNAPDGDVGQDPRRERVGVHSSGTAPVQGNRVPGQGPTDDGNVDEPRRLGVAEVRRGEIEEIDDQQEFSPPEVAAHPEHDEAEQQQVVRDEVAADVARGLDVGRVAGVQVADVAQLHKVQHDPIDRGDDRVHRKRRVAVAVLLPDPVPVGSFVFAWSAEGVEDGAEDGEEPGQDS